MKLTRRLLRQIIKEEIVEFPSAATASDRYTSFLENMSAAVSDLESIEEIMSQNGFDLSDIRMLIAQVKLSKDDETLKYDIDSL
mgnify:FL=1